MKSYETSTQSASRQIIATLMAIMLITSMLMPCASSPFVERASASSTTVSLTKVGNIQYSSGSWNTHIFHANDGEGETIAYCVEPSLNSPAEGDYTKMAISTPSGRDAELRADLWFAYGGTGFDASMWPSTNWNGEAMSSEDYYLCSHILLADTYSSSGVTATYGADDSFREWVAYNIIGCDMATGAVTNRDAVGRVIKRSVGKVPAKFEAFLIDGGDQQNIAACSYFPPVGDVKMQKDSKIPGITNGNSCYNMKGIEYRLYTSSDCKSSSFTGYSLRLDASGYAELTDMSAGTYYVQEVESSVTGTGYAYDSTIYKVSIPVGGVAWVHDTANGHGDVEGNNVEDTPITEDIDVIVQKHDIITQSPVPSSIYNLSNALFSVRYYANLKGNTSGSAARSWTFKTDDQGRIDIRNNLAACFVSGDALYRNPATDEVLFPLGTYRITELSAPVGYESPSDVAPVSFTIVQAGSGQYDTNADEVLGNGYGVVFNEKPVRHDMSFTKRDLDTQRPMAGIPFMISQLDKNGTILERHVVITDANGVFDSSASHIAHTTRMNANDVNVTRNPDGTYVVNEDALVKDTGVWFGQAADGRWYPANNDLGAFPDSTEYKYLVEELPVAANEGKALVSFEAYAYAEKSSDIDLGTVGNSTPTLVTSARDGADGDKLVSRDYGSVVYDSVAYDGLVAGRTYTMRGSLVDAATGQALLDARGREITTTETFVAQACTGTIEMMFTFDAVSVPDGTKAVACEMLFEGNRPLAMHNSLDDSAQTVTIVQPTIQTHAADYADGDSALVGDVDTTIIDRVMYAGLTPGKQYELSGVVMDKETGAPYISQGQEVRARQAFTPDESTGFAEMTFTFDATDLAPGHEFVVFEELMRDGTVLARHDDINDGDQTVVVFPPSLETSAADPDDGDNIISADTETVIVDTVAFSGLRPGNEYVLEGILVDKDTGYPMLDPFGRTITATHSFVPLESSGSTDVTFTFDASNIDTSAVGVVFEELYRDGRHLASHIDLEDAPQTFLVEQPRIQTFASVDGNSKNLMRDDNVSIVDVVSFSNLKVGKTYSIEGVVVEKNSGEPLISRDGTEAHSQIEFTASETSGSVELPFTFDTTLVDANTELVVFERLLHEGVELATHEDIDDARQTVTVCLPKIHTTARSENDTKELIRDTDATVVDTVSYESLMPGSEYLISGTLMDKASGEKFIDANGQEVTAEARFTPEHANGEIDLSFTFDASALEAGSKLVVFEKLTHDEREIATHEDIDDADQTVTVQPPVIITSASDPEDGDQVVLSREDARILDTVTYEGLKPGAEYEFVGTLMDKASGEPLVNAQDKPVQSTATFTPEEQNGTLEVVFTYDLSGATEERAIVVFEDLYRDGKLLAAHDDLDNISQTIMVTPPLIRTHAYDASDGDKEILRKGKATITDTVEYVGLEAGKTYRITGELMVNDGTLEGSAACDAFGTPITAYTDFTPDASHGSVDVNFDIDTSIVKDGCYLVAFETLWHKEIVQAAHKDLQDEEQTVRVVSPPAHVLGKIFKKTPTNSTLAATTTQVTEKAQTPEKTQVTGKAVDTGDRQMLPFAICAALSMLALLGLVWLRYRIVPKEK